MKLVHGRCVNQLLSVLAFFFGPQGLAGPQGLLDFFFFGAQGFSAAALWLQGALVMPSVAGFAASAANALGAATTEASARANMEQVIEALDFMVLS